MQERHQNQSLYFQEQGITTKNYVIPFIENYTHKKGTFTNVLEIGCGLGGGLKPFLDAGYYVTGIDLLQKNIDFASTQFAEHPHKDNLHLICSDIYKVTDLETTFDVVVIRDVLEHVPEQAYFLSFIKQFLSPDGVVFIAFPPWQNPFGGHQQVLKNRFLSHCPWLHLLPTRWYSSILERHHEEGGVNCWKSRS